MSSSLRDAIETRHPVSPQPQQDGQSLVEFALIFPFLMLLVLAIGDFARWYSTAITIESAAREAADYGAFSAERWATVNITGTEAEMQRRACTAASTLSGYQGDAVGTPGMTCSNPTVVYAIDPPSPFDCSNNANDPPCKVTVTVTYQFDLLVPIPVVTPSFSFSRDSTYAVSPFPAS